VGGYFSLKTGRAFSDDNAVHSLPRAEVHNTMCKIKAKVKQSPYRPRVAQRVPGS